MPNKDDLFGERLRSYRKQRNLSQADLASQLGKTGAALSDWERGRSGPSLLEIEQLAKILRCDPGRLAFGVVYQGASKDSEISEDKSAFNMRGYTDRSVDNTPSSDSSTRSFDLVADPNYIPNDDDRSTRVLEDVKTHMLSLWELAQENPDTAAVIRYLLETHISPDQLKRD